MSWNIVLNKIIEIKNKYIEKFEKIDYSGEGKNSCVMRWVEELDINEYKKLLFPLVINQYGDLILFKYSLLKLFNVKNGSDDELIEEQKDAALNESINGDLDYDDFWNIDDGFYRECRSLVINVKTNELVLTPFRKFFNLNEIEETSYKNISERIKKAKCIEFSDKLDGSMQSARYYDSQVVMSGSSALDPELSFQLKDGYRMLNDNENYQRMLKENSDLTFVFEYISQSDAHVVQYDKTCEGLYLIGIRDVNTGTEYPYDKVLSFASKYSIRTTKLFDKTLDKVLAELDDKKSNEAEGFVLNVDGYKVKIKYNDYVQMHRLLTLTSSPNFIIRCIADGHFDDTLAKVPSVYRKRFLFIADKVFSYINEMDNICNSYVKEGISYSESKENKMKEFMIWTENSVPKKYRGYVRDLYKGKSVNYIKSGSKDCPKYEKAKKIGISMEDLNET